MERNQLPSRERFLEAQYTFSDNLAKIKNELTLHEDKVLYIKNHGIKPLPKRKGIQKALKKKNDRKQMRLARQTVLNRINVRFTQFSAVCSDIEMNRIADFDLSDYSDKFTNSLNAYRHLFGPNPAKSKRPVESNELIALIDSLQLEQIELQQTLETDESITEATQNADYNEFPEESLKKALLKEKFHEIRSLNPCKLERNPSSTGSKATLKLGGKTYQVKEKIGSGGINKIYLFVSEDSHEVVVKIRKKSSKNQYYSCYEVCMHFFARGKIIANTKENRHIVQFLATGVDDRGQVFTVMEYMPNGDVQNLIDNMSIQKVRDIKDEPATMIGRFAES